MKRVQKNFESDPMKNFFVKAKPSAVWKQKITNWSSWFNNEKKKPGKKKKFGKFAETCPKKVWVRSGTKNFFASKTLWLSNSKKSRTEVRDLIIPRASSVPPAHQRDTKYPSGPPKGYEISLRDILIILINYFNLAPNLI